MRYGIMAPMLVVGLAAQAMAEPVGATDSRSAHEADDAAEALEEVHRPQHGGYFGDADDLFHYELLLEGPNRLILYVNDEWNRPLDTSRLEGRWTLWPDAPEPVVGSFALSADGSRLVASLPPLEGAQVHVEVAVKKEGRWVPMEFVVPTPAPPSQGGGNP